MYCRGCGKELPEHAKFCRGCGTPVDDMNTVTNNTGTQNYDTIFWVLFALSASSLILPFISILKFNTDAYSSSELRSIASQFGLDYDSSFSVVTYIFAIFRFNSTNQELPTFDPIYLLCIVLFVIVFAIAMYFFSSSLKLFLAEGVNRRSSRTKIFKRLFYIPSEVLVEIVMISLLKLYNGTKITAPNSSHDEIISFSYGALGIIVI